MKKYPSLVEQIYYHMVNQGTIESKEFIFKYLRQQNLLDDNGNPTDKAIENGLVQEATSKIDKFKANHPAFIDFNKSDFHINDSRQLEIKPAVLKKNLEKLKKVHNN